ncbi:hypothetical protein NEIRO03_1830 [Nematocida sp. AWRm78]|nr:hypothetical protein NEIRO02_1869 [Nematocida sp. AWRm79]KAI5184707.1 hypothetical protein NEIRO03_1830 [Nematocida sp. AWRm78]
MHTSGLWDIICLSVFKIYWFVIVRQRFFLFPKQFLLYIFDNLWIISAIIVLCASIVYHGKFYLEPSAAPLSLVLCFCAPSFFFLIYYIAYHMCSAPSLPSYTTRNIHRPEPLEVFIYINSNGEECTLFTRPAETPN